MTSIWLTALEHEREAMIRRSRALEEHRVHVYIGMPDAPKFSRYLRSELTHGYRLANQEYKRTRHSEFCVDKLSHPGMVVTFNAMPFSFSSPQVQFNTQMDGYHPVQEDRAMLRRLIALWEGEFTVRVGHPHVDLLVSRFQTQVIHNSFYSYDSGGPTSPSKNVIVYDYDRVMSDDQGNYEDAVSNRFSNYTFYQSDTPWLLATVNVQAYNLKDLVWKIETDQVDKVDSP